MRGETFSENRRLQEAQDGATQTCSERPKRPIQSRGCAASTMERPPILTAPIIASDTWFAEGSAVIDAKVTESSQEWTELMQLHKKAQSGGPPIERARLKLALARGGGVPMDMRAEVWFTFSGAADRMAQHPTVYDQLCKRVAAFHEASAAAGGAPSASENDFPSRISTTEQTAYRVLEQVEKDLRRTEVGSDGDKLSAMRRVLCAFASFNPDVGYVQGMNFIVVALLRVFDEQQTFWMLALIVQVCAHTLRVFFAPCSHTLYPSLSLCRTGCPSTSPPQWLAITSTAASLPLSPPSTYPSSPHVWPHWMSPSSC